MDKMMQEICKYPNGTYLKVNWEKEQLVLEGTIDTIYESDNGLEEDDDNYTEFYACAFRIEKVCKNAMGKVCAVGNLIELSVENQPTLITLQDGNILWKGIDCK